MPQERAKAPTGRGALRVVRGAAMTPIIDLADGIRLYAAPREQTRQLSAVMEDVLNIT